MAESQSVVVGVAIVRREEVSYCTLTLCMLGNFSYFCCRLLIFFKNKFSENSLRNVITVSNSLDPDQD